MQLTPTESPTELEPPAKGTRWLKLAFGLFGVWALILVGALMVEGTRSGRRFFDHTAGIGVYFALQVATTIAALAACVVTLVRGPTRHRVAVLLPLSILGFYVALAIAGPG